MGLQILDGKGKGNLAGVNNDNEMLVRATSISEAKAASEKGNAFTITTDKIVVNTGAPQHVLYIENLDAKPFIIDKVLFSWDGGSTFNRVMQGHVHIGPDAPTANNATVVPDNLNLGAPNNANLKVEKFDGTGTAGMTIAAAGPKAMVQLFERGSTEVDYAGALTLKVGDSISLMMIGEITGNGSIAVFGHFQEDGA